MAYAIIEASGTQLRVEPGRFYDLNRLGAEENEAVILDRVLLIEKDGDVMIGRPLLDGAVVEGTVQRHLRGRKVIVYKMKPKKKTRKKRGHRQELTRVMVTAIKLNGEVLASDESAADDLSALAADTEMDLQDSDTPEAVSAPVEDDAVTDETETQATVTEEEPAAAPDEPENAAATDAEDTDPDPDADPAAIADTEESPASDSPEAESETDAADEPEAESKA